MKIIIAPAKKMRIEDDIAALSQPVFLRKTATILEALKSKSKEELKTLWHVNDTLLTENIERLHTIDLENAYSPAIYSYVGIQYQYLSVNTLENEDIDYLHKHLRILSAFYGVLKPLDAISQYRLEMCQKLRIDHFPNLYDFWGKDLYDALEDNVIVNLASDEYSKCIKKYLNKNDQFITVHFGEVIQDKFITKGTIAKMARGEMVRYMAVNKIKNIEEIKNFQELDFKYSEDLSNDANYYFIRSSLHD